MFSLGLLLLGCSQFAIAKVVEYNWSIDWVNRNPDGAFPRPVIGINGEWPCPQIDVDLGDHLIVTIYNNLGNESTGLHWHGLNQYGHATMDGSAGTAQCPVPPNSTFTYSFPINQTGSYWYHSHTQGQYPDGLRGPLIVHDANFPYHYDEEITMTFSDWYHEQMPTLLNYYQSTADVNNNSIQSGQAPIPVAGLINDSQNNTIKVLPGKTYLIHMIDMANFPGVAVYFDGHPFTAVGVDGTTVEKYYMGDEILRIAPAQRWDILITTKNDTSKNFVIFATLDVNMLFPPLGIPSIEGWNGNTTAWLVYDEAKPLPPQKTFYSFEFFDEVNNLIPYDRMPLLEPVDRRIEMTLENATFDGITRFTINNVTYLPQKVPSLYTALSVGNYSTDPVVYGVNSNPFVLNYGEIIEVVVNNKHENLHPMHLHGHQYQVLQRGYPDTGGVWDGVYDQNVSATPVRRDTVMLNKNSSSVWRFKADNPGVWLFHCHIEYHITSGLVATIVEAPDYLGNLTVPRDHIAACKRYGMDYQGNAGANTRNPLDVSLQVTSANASAFSPNFGAIFPPPKGAGSSTSKKRSLLVDLSHIPSRNLQKVSGSHIPSRNLRKASGYTAADDGLSNALKDADVVIVAAGAGITAEMASRDSSFQQSALVMRELVREYAGVCAEAIMLVVTNPVNAIVPFIAELLKRYGVFDARRLFRVTTLDVVRAETFLGDEEGWRGGEDRVFHVVGGRSPPTIVPLMSQARPPAQVGWRELEGVVNRVRFGGREVYYAKERNCAATLSTAYATLRFTQALCKCLRGEKDMVECAYVHLPGIEGGVEIAEAVGVEYFAVPVEFMHGASRVVNPLGTISSKEQILIDIAVPALRQNIHTGVDAAKNALSDEKPR
ncbi:MAG: hypothetical protein ASARMPREDX12_007388 [Alectoria sarmentosa]|nr:MAG: hypothetical protein ASARMPREDX12_007388 [Alectoria sarmentosa]